MTEGQLGSRLELAVVALMLQNASQQVRNCLQHAEEYATHRAKVEPDPNLQRDFLVDGTALVKFGAQLPIL